MTSYRGKPAATINANMKSIIPETGGCNFADFPMAHERWYKPNEKIPSKGGGGGGGGKEGIPCFIKTDNKLPPEGAKTGYIWGPGQFGFGYYHLMTKNAHSLIFNRLQNNKVLTGADEGICDCCCFGSSDPATKLPPCKTDDKDDLRILFHARSVAKIPNDGVAKQNQIEEASAVAQAHHTYNQNIQTGVFIANQMAR